MSGQMISLGSQSSGPLTGSGSASSGLVTRLEN